MTSYKTKRDWILADLKDNKIIVIGGDAQDAFCKWFNLSTVTFARVLHKVYKEGLITRRKISSSHSWHYVYEERK